MVKKYTNPVRNDGFGAQLQNIIWTYIFCRMNNYEYYYQPFSNVEHNYDNDINFVKNIEGFLNFKEQFNLSNNNIKGLSSLYTRTCYDYIERNILSHNYEKYLNEFKEYFYKNKELNYFKNNYTNVAVHVRRPNKQDDRIEGGNTPDDYYLNVIKNIKEKYFYKYLIFHIYSQGDLEKFKIYENQDTILHINENMLDTFKGMIFSDILVTSPSSFSYTAALLNNGEIYYKPFWHPPMNNWIIC
jgi:hypothetical protein